MPPSEKPFATPESNGNIKDHLALTHENRSATSDDEKGSGDEEGEVEVEEEPRLKYNRLTRSLGGVYRNGDAVSVTLLFGERMILGTHNGNIHILSLPSLSVLRTYHAHSASVTSISISPPPPPPSAIPNRKTRDAMFNDRTFTIATSSIDGLVCSVPLLPSTPPQAGQTTANVPYTKAEITMKNFKRPILAVALSPNFRTDRLYLSGGLAGNLVLSTATSTAVTGSWMTLGMGAHKDTILHSGEGTISTIAWSKESPRYVSWANEQGIKVMRSHIIPPNMIQGDEIAGNPGIAAWIPGLGVGGKPAGEVAWKRISAIERPETIPEELASVYKPILRWIDRRSINPDEESDEAKDTGASLRWGDREKLVVGWGGTVWVIDVFAGTGEGEDGIGWAEIVHILQTDCTISGIHLYSPSLLLILAHLTNEDTEVPGASGEAEELNSTGPPRARRGRSNALTPELRFIDLRTSEEISADELMMSRFENLAPGDYHLGVLPRTPQVTTLSSSGASAGDMFSGFATGIWTVGANAMPQLLSGSASVASFGSGPGNTGASRPSSTLSAAGTLRAGTGKKECGWGEEHKGTKIYIASPYDIVYATERSTRDHLQWMLDRRRYEEAWRLVDKHPDVVEDDDAAGLSMYDEEERRVVEGSDAGYDSDSTISRKQRSIKRYSNTEKEKRRIGELWLQELIRRNVWGEAGRVCGLVLGTSSRWEHWVWVFEAAGKIQEITDYIPTTQLSPPLPTVIYEIVLAHYLSHEPHRFRCLLLDCWKPDSSLRTLYDARTIIDAIHRRLNNREDEIENGDTEWQILQECLANLYMILKEPRNALHHYVALKDADQSFYLIREYRLVDAVRDDIPSIIRLRISSDQLDCAPVESLESATTEAITLLVDEADRGILSPQNVVSQLDSDSVKAGRVFLFFYLRRLWHRDHELNASSTGAGIGGGGILADFGDLMVELFAEYDRPLLLEFLRDSHTYSLELASRVCERRSYIPELVHLLSKTGQTKRALFLIIDELQDVAQAISFAKSQDDPDLWSDLIDYSMDKPRFLKGLLENVGTAIDPIALIKRIPEKLQIEGLKEALGKILREYGVQWSISDGVAKALRSEVSVGMEGLREGQRRGVKVDVGATNCDRRPSSATITGAGTLRPSGCRSCGEVFHSQERETLIAFACGHLFHLRCMLDSPKSELEIDNLEMQIPGLGPLEVEDYVPAGMGRSVGAKVTHAALVRNRVASGCTICKKRKEDEIDT